MKPSIKFIFRVRIISRSKGTFVPKSIPIVFQMAEKNAKTRTHKQKKGNNSAKNIFLKLYGFRTHSRSKSNFVTKGIPIGVQMAEKNANTQTDRHFRIYISRDMPIHGKYQLFISARANTIFIVITNHIIFEWFYLFLNNNHIFPLLFRY